MCLTDGQAEEKEACANFEPQSFKPNQCINCFMPKSKHSATGAKPEEGEAAKQTPKVGGDFAKKLAGIIGAPPPGGVGLAKPVKKEIVKPEPTSEEDPNALAFVRFSP